MLNKKIFIRKMKEDDITRVIEIENESFSSPWRAEHFLFEIVNNPYSLNGVLIENSNLKGYVCGWVLDQELHINNVAVSTVSRKQGFGYKLMEWILTEGKRLKCEYALLEVREDNISAINLYREMGFEINGIREKYYSDTNKNAILFFKNL